MGGKGEFYKTGTANLLLLLVENVHRGNSCAFSVKFSCYFCPVFFTPAALCPDMMSKNTFASRIFVSLSQGAAVVLV